MPAQASSCIPSQAPVSKHDGYYYYYRCHFLSTQLDITTNGTYLRARKLSESRRPDHGGSGPWFDVDPTGNVYRFRPTDMLLVYMPLVFSTLYYIRQVTLVARVVVPSI